MLQALGVDTNIRNARAMLKGAVDLAGGLAFINSREGHAAEIPAANMIGDAASLARMYAATIGEVDGVRLLKPETVSHAMRWLTKGLVAPGDLVKLPAPSPHRYGLGYQLTRMAAPMLGEGSFGHTVPVVGSGTRTRRAALPSATSATTCSGMDRPNQMRAGCPGQTHCA